ncbi:MFS transporter [Pseudarthrobacter sp. TAF60_1]|uniref:MFS transporter n=1 Tax=Pseudarthrobacter sp. TAF60_1 TaxID=3233071 RepID=UPI003F9AD852
MYISVSDRRGGKKDEEVAAGARTRRPETRFKVSHTIVWLGVVSMFTDVSSESVAAILPLYVTGFLGLSTIAFGIIDGINQGASAVVRIGAGWVSDRTGQPKLVAAAGYGLSAVARIGFLFAGGFWSIAGVVTGDRIGKGLRTAPRDALISASAQPEYLARSFGVHRMLDSIGAAAGPLLAFLVLVLIPNGFSTVFIISLAFAVLGVAVLVLMVPGRVRGATSEVGGVRRSPFRWSRLRWITLKNQGLARLLVTAGLLGFLTIGDGFIYLLLQNRGSFAVQWFPMLFVGTNVVYLLFAIPLGKLADRWGRIPVFLCGHLALLACYILAALPFAGLGSTIGCLVLLGLFYAATDGVLAAIVTQLSPVASLATALGAAQTVVALSRMAAATAFGVLWFLLGPVTAVVWVAVVLAAALGAGTFLTGGFRRWTAAR